MGREKKSILNAIEQTALLLAAVDFSQDHNSEKYLSKIGAIFRNKLIELADKELALKLI